MDDITKSNLKELLSKGKDCNSIEKYKMYYKIATGATHKNGCSACACRYLFNYLSAYIGMKG